MTSVLYANCGSGAQKSFKRLAFTQKSEKINLLSTSKGGIDGIFYCIKIGLILTNMFWGLLLGR